MNNPTFFEVQASSRKKFGFTEIDSNEFETAKAIYFDYWPPMQSKVTLVQIGKKISESKI
jgi:hypothetical protein